MSVMRHVDFRLCPVRHSDDRLGFMEVEMKTGRLFVKNFDARIPKIEIRPKGSSSKIVILSKIRDENEDRRINLKIIFDNVAAIEFCINYFDNRKKSSIMPSSRM